jgi:prepilin-type N-terminal cleavage/methylation domain-containing protein
MRRERNKAEAGFSLVELMAVVLIILVVGGIATPNILNLMHMARLRGSSADFSSLLQTARMRAVQDDKYYSTYIIAGPPQSAYVDLTVNGGTGVAAGDPMVLIASELTPTAAANAPATTNLKGLFLPAGAGLAVKDGTAAGSQIIFGPRGLPCTTVAATGGNVCDSAGGATAFWVFFQDNSTSAWEAITVSPAGRISKWQYGNGSWTRL